MRDIPCLLNNYEETIPALIDNSKRFYKMFLPLVKVRGKLHGNENKRITHGIHTMMEENQFP